MAAPTMIGTYGGGWTGPIEDGGDFRSGFGAEVHFGDTSYDVYRFGGRSLAFTIHRDWVSHAEVHEWSSAYGMTNVWMLTGGKTHGPTSGVVIVLTNGVRVTFQVVGPPVQASAWLVSAGVPVEPRAPNSPAAAASTADELKKLAELRDAGVLSAEEFEALKAKLLG